MVVGGSERIGIGGRERESESILNEDGDEEGGWR